MNGCCIVETRIIGNLQDIIQQKHLNFIPRSWGLTLFLSEANKHLIHKEMFDREVQIFFLPDVFREYQYNYLLTFVSFWEKLPYKNVLIFQTDSEILKEGIEDFVGKYAFIGAPDEREAGMMNGGLSLRNVALCRNVCHVHQYDFSINEDWWFCSKLPSGLMPGYDEAAKFSIETKYREGSLGCHAIEKWLTPEQIVKIRRQYK